MSKTLYILQGIPGSGKSTIAKMIADIEGAVIFSTDDFWYQRYEHTVTYDFDITKIGEAHRWNQQRTAKEMAAPSSWHIIIDNTNIKRRDAQPYFTLAGIYGYDVQVVSVQVPIEVAIARQAGRPKDRQIPEVVIRKMHENMERLDA